MDKQIPKVVKFCAVLYYILVGFIFLFGFLLFSFATSTLFGAMKFGEALIFVIPITLLLAILPFFIGRGLWRGQPWSRIVAIILSSIFFISSLASIIKLLFSISVYLEAGPITSFLFRVIFSIVSLVINGLIIIFLGFNEKARTFFC